ncbi:family 20 glycosylhydrolase [Pseudoalteromonas sp. MMG012]|uniref:family 20 glycosylhydrolase n=1 Tax=Pseudoalteromonas sp. MMG012 TaxID=2822686 RepID=UPI001B39F126|nr:family 20 glycosylhydrolase [Pseudoalteromonas sp. MMG012]MBQ4851896.1 carbohydate-binding domain-containing protein [Pseudoalteromonas sp. MMG012]
MTLKQHVLASLLVTTPLFANADLSQSQLNAFTKNTKLVFSAQDNFHNGASSLIASMTLTNNSDIALVKGKADWQIYIHSVRKIHTKSVKGFTIEHVNGDLHRFVPNKDFAGLAVGESLTVEFEAGAWIAAYSDFMPRAFMVSKQHTPAIFANTDTEDFKQYIAPFERENQLRRYNDPIDKTQLASAQLRYERNLSSASISKEAALKRIIPTPQKADFNRGTAVLDSSWQIRFAGRLTSEVAVLKSDLADYGLELESEADHIKASKAPTIYLKVDESLADGAAESYQLEIDDDKIEIIGSDNAGVFYGIQSLLALFPAGSKNTITVPNVEIEDTPRFVWRGMHYDNARNYHGKDALFKLVEQMARYKLNKFHWHFSDDEGWRVEIPGLPELTEIGAHRCFDLEEQRCLLTQLGTGPFKSGSGNGFLSRKDFVELIKFADARHIQIIPEIEGPGHARAAIKSMEARYNTFKAKGKLEQAKAYLLTDPKDESQYITVQNYTDNSFNVCLDSTYAFIEKVTYELQSMYRDAGTRLTNLHFGGDEVGAGSWTQSPACDALFMDANNGIAGPADLKPYFTQKVAHILAKRGISPGAWEDGLMYDKVNPFKRDEFPNDIFTANVWDNIWEWGVADRAYRLANDGYQVVLSHGTHLYFDHPYEAHPEERGYYWATRFVDTKKAFSYMPDDVYANADFTRTREPIVNLEALVGRAMPKLEKPENILGMQGQVWSETIRTEEQVLAMIFPRILSVAERAWHKAKWEGDDIAIKPFSNDWQSFSAALAIKELPKLVASGVNVNLPVPGAVKKGALVYANSAFPYLDIEYSLDRGQTWQLYSDPISHNDGQSVQLRTRVGDKNTSRITELK